MDDPTPPDEPWQERRTEGALHLRAWATQDQLALGLASAREVFAARGFLPGYCGIAAIAVRAHEADASLPEPSPALRAAAAALKEAGDAAILAAGGLLDQDSELSVSQSPEDRKLWNSLPTLRAWRIKHKSPRLDMDAPEAPWGG